MRRSMKTQSRKKEQSCDICGDVGFAPAISTCCICHASHEHIYCMKYNLHEVPQEWSCEACSSSKMKDLPREAHSCKNRMTLCTESDSPRMSESTNSRDAGKISSSPRKSPFSPPKNYIKVVETGKVKFLPAEDVVALTSGISQVKVSAWRGLRSQVGSLSSLRFPTSRRTPISVAEASRRFSQKESACRSSRPPTPLMNGSMKKSTGLQQEVVKTCPQDRSAKEKSNEPNFLDKPAVIVIPNEDHVSEKPLDVIPPPKKVSTSLTKTKAVYRAQNASSPLLEAKQNVLPKAEELPNHYAIKPTWKGNFEILGNFSPGAYFEGLRAHPPGKVSRKAYEFSKKMPTMLQFKVHPRCDVWSEIFYIDCPTGEDIALYFFPEDINSSKEKYHCLLESIEAEDLAMSTVLNGVELIIFTSRQLPMNSQRLNMKFFLWGVFRSSKRQLLSPSVTEETDQVVDMDIDMVGGKDIGRVDYVLRKPILEGNKVQSTILAQKAKYPISTALDFLKLDSSKNGDGVADSRNDEAGLSPNVVSNVHADQPMTRNITPALKIKREMSTDFGAPPPGFSRTVTSDAAQKGVVEKPLGWVPTVGRNLERPPGFSKFLRPKETIDSSEAGDRKEKAGISQNSSKKENINHSYPAKRVFKESSLLSHKDIKDRESLELPFISQQQVVNHGFPKKSTSPDPTPSAEKRKFQSEHKLFKTETKKCQLEQHVKKEPMEETDPPRMLSLSRVYIKDEHRRYTKQ